MTPQSLPGEMPHRAPPDEVQARLMQLSPYVREAVEMFRPTWRFESRKILDYLLVHWVEGAGDVVIGKHAYRAKSGDLFWVPPNTLHAMSGDAPGTKLQYIHFDLIYDPDRSHWSARIPGGATDLSFWMELMHPSVEDSEIQSWCGRLNIGNRTAITELLRRIILEYNRMELSGLAVSGLVMQLMGTLLENSGAENSLDMRHVRTIEHAMHDIQLNSHGKLHVETLARQHGLSATHFRKLFKEHYRQSPRDAHLNSKMRAACDYLIYSELSVSEIADRLGFANVHNFSRAFHKAIGCAPTAYRAG